jgi:hypothetical protein
MTIGLIFVPPPLFDLWEINMEFQEKFAQLLIFFMITFVAQGQSPILLHGVDLQFVVLIRVPDAPSVRSASVEVPQESNKFG